MERKQFSHFESKLSKEFRLPKKLLAHPNYNNLNLYTKFIDDYDIPEFVTNLKANYLDLRTVQDKDWAVVLVSQGVDLANSNEYDKAIQKYESALDLDNKCLSAWIAKGIALANSKEYKEAIRHFKKALEVDPNHAKAQEFLNKTRNFHNNIQAEMNSAYTGEFLMSTEYDSKSQSENSLKLANVVCL